LLAFQSDGVIDAAICNRRAFLAIERLKQIAGAHTAAIRMLCLALQCSGTAFGKQLFL
jgi:hypothetical protein